MGKYNFDKVIDRHGTDCLKYDFGMKRKGRDDLLPLWVADMDFRLPDEILDEFHKRIDHGIFGYTDPLDDYFDAMNHWFSTRYGYTIDSEWVTLGAGIVYALGTSVRAFTEEGDTMMVMQPVYYPFSEVIKNDGRKLVNCQLRYENNHYSIDFEKMEQMIKEENVKALIFCNPHNPVGRVWTREEMEQVAEICLKYNVVWMVDEMHCDFIFPGHEFTHRYFFRFPSTAFFHIFYLWYCFYIIVIFIIFKLQTFCPLIIHMKEKEFQNLSNKHTDHRSCHQWYHRNRCLKKNSSGSHNDHICNTAAKNRNMPGIFHFQSAYHIDDHQNSNKCNNRNHHLDRKSTRLNSSHSV